MFSFFWPIGQAVKTPPFHGGNTGSNPVWVTIILSVFVVRLLIGPKCGSRKSIEDKQWAISSAGRAPALQAGCRQFDPVIAHHYRWPRGVVVNMPACHAGDRRFKSDRGRHFISSLARYWVGGRVVKGGRL